MFSHLLKLRFPILLFIVGTFLTVISFFNVADIKKLELTSNPSPVYPIFAFGVLIVAVSFVIFILTETSIDWRLSRVRTEDNGYSIRIERAHLKVRFGKIQDCGASEPGCVVALPANEFFDDECIKEDTRSLGAYIKNAFPAGVNAIRELITKEVSGFEYTDLEKEPGVRQKSYGIGKCIYLKNPLGSSRNIFLVSVATKRCGEGLRSRPDYLIDAIGAIRQSMLDNRLTDLHLPVFGAGEGGLRTELALHYIVLAISESLHNKSWQNLRSATIIVFQRDSSVDPEISRKAVKRSLSFAASIFS